MLKNKLLFPICPGIIIIVLLAAGIRDNFITRQGWDLLSAEIMLVLLLLFYLGFESGKASSREISIIAVLAAIAAVGRIPFAFLPGVQPTTFLVIISGFVYGPQAGFMVGSTAALVSNFFLGQGPWTPAQMLAWGMAGALAGLVKKVYPAAGIKFLYLYSFTWGYLFGWLVNLWFWTAFIRPLTWQSFLTTYIASFWMDTLHSLGNAAFCLLFGAGFIKIMTRFRKKLKLEIFDQSTEDAGHKPEENEAGLSRPDS